MTALAPAPRPAAHLYSWRPVAALFGALLVIGAVLGVVWSGWSPPGPRGALLGAGTQADETEAFAAADGRFALITAVVGILAGVVAWYLRPQRGWLVALALGAGGVGGSMLTDLVGRWIRGQGPEYPCGPAGKVRCTEHLPLWVQMPGLLFLEAALAVLVYSLFVAFAVDDDLGQPDPVREARLATRSVGPQPGLEHPRGDGYRAGTPQQDDFAPQYPDQPAQPPGGGEFGQQ